jgi:hypothetical protein
MFSILVRIVQFYKYRKNVSSLGMVKPHLPESIEKSLPRDVVNYIYTFVPHMEKTPTPKTSPSLEKQLRRIQAISLKGKSSMYMNELDDFILDHNKYLN